MTIYLLVILWTHEPPYVTSYDTPQEACSRSASLSSASAVYRASLDMNGKLILGKEYKCPVVEYPR